MQAQQDVMSVDNLFSPHKVQYIIPIYQRRYVWTETNWSMLWEDIKEKTNLRINNEELVRQHFTGPIVVWPYKNEEAEVPKHEIIDGQQRLTTFQIILCVIRDICQSEYPNNDQLRDIIEDVEKYTKNKDSGINPDDQCKLRTTIHDKEAFQALVYNHFRCSNNNNHLIYGMYNYFMKKIKDFATTPEAITGLFISITHDFIIVRINLDNNDEPERIFASLNATGKMLYEFDYLRNYLFLRAKTCNASESDLYNRYWIHFEKWDSETLELFLWDFLKVKLGPEKCIQAQKKKDKRAFDLYREYSQTWGNNIESEFAQLQKYASSYRNIRNNNPNSEIYCWMQFYDDLGITSLHPFILFIVTYEKLTDDERNEIFAILESYIVRWMLCCGNNEDRINGYRYTRIDNFLSKVIKEGKFSVKEFVTFLGSGSPTDAWPTDNQVKDALRKAGAWDVDARLIVYILYRIELLKRQGKPYQDADSQLRFKDLGNREHIMPRKWSNHWPLTEKLYHKDLYDSAYKDTESAWREKRDQREHLVSPNDLDHEKAYNLVEERHDNIDSIGNLIPLLKCLNSDLSDHSFEEKKRILNDKTTVHLRLTQEILKHDSWDVEQIRKREQDLCNDFFRVWQPAEYFLKSKSDKVIESEAHVFITNKGEKNLTQIETFSDRVTGVNDNSTMSDLQKSYILFVCSKEAWPLVKDSIALNSNDSSSCIQVKEWLLESVQNTQNFVKAKTRSGHVLRGKIESFDDEAIYLIINSQTVIIYKKNMCEFKTEGWSFNKQIESFEKKPNQPYGFIKFFGYKKEFFVHKNSLSEVENGFTSLTKKKKVEFDVTQTVERLLSVHKIRLAQ